MKNVQNVSSLILYIANRAEKVSSINNVKTNSEYGEFAQKIDFLKFADAEGNTHYFISVVHRGCKSDYSGKKTWIENLYTVSKEEGNKIYTEAKQGKTITINE